MNKYALGTIVGTALLPLLKGKGSKIKLGLGTFYTIILSDVLIRESKDSHLSETTLSKKIQDKIRKMVLGGNKDKDFINILKPIIFNRDSLFGYSFSIEVKGYWRNRCEEDVPNQWGQEMEVCKYDFRIVFASVRDVSNLPDNEDEIIMDKVEDLIKSSISSYIDMNGYDFEPIMDEAEFAIYKGVQDRYDQRNRHTSLAIKTKDGTWDSYDKSSKTNNTLSNRLRRK